MTNYTPVKNRIEVVDFIRGFAIMAIMFLHNIERFNLYIFPGGWEDMSTLDRSVWDTLFFMFGGKTYSLFALLFGFTFHIMYSKAKAKGFDFGNRFLWRLLLLAIFASVNAAFFPGEVLMLYAATGLFLYVFRKASNKVILLASIIFLLQPLELFYFLKDVFDSSFEIPKQINWSLHKEVKEYINEGTFIALVKGNTTIGQAWSMLWAIENGRFSQTVGLFLLGMLIGKKELYNTTKANTRVWYKIITITLVTSVTFFILRRYFYIDRTFEYYNSIGIAIDMWWKLSGTLVWLSLLVLLFTTNVFRKITKPFLAYGKMSLTNYVAQSIIGSILYFPFALNLAPKIGVAESFLLGIVLFIVQIIFCNWWISKYKQGPLEKLWHKLTWLKK